MSRLRPAHCPFVSVVHQEYFGVGVIVLGEGPKRFPHATVLHLGGNHVALLLPPPLFAGYSQKRAAPKSQSVLKGSSPPPPHFSLCFSL